MPTEAPDFALPNVGEGPDPFALSTLPPTVEFVVLFFQRDHYCTECRKQVRTVAERYDEFRERGAEVASVFPEPADRVREWRERDDLPYPLLADPETAVAGAYDQPVRFGILGTLSDFFGRMPQVVIVDRRGAEPAIAEVYRGSSTFDRPDLDELLRTLDELADGAE